MVGKWVDANNNGLAEARVGDEAARVDSNAIDATVNITAADLPVIVQVLREPGVSPIPIRGRMTRGTTGSTTAPHESVCVVCHVEPSEQPQPGRRHRSAPGRLVT